MIKNIHHFFHQSLISPYSWLLLFCCYAYALQAQQFKVRRFRVLPNDITAYIEPVKDLNNEACALIKVVGSSDFVFSTPLGIVRQVYEVGEILVYLPKGSKQITIKHPQWGVLRDYHFPYPLESRMTYELELAPTVGAAPVPLPQLKDEPASLDTTAHQSDSLTLHPTTRIKRPREPWCKIATVNWGIGKAGPTYGVRLALMRRHGAYLAFQSDLRGNVATLETCSKDGALSGKTVYPYYTGEKKKQLYTITAGGIHRVFSELCIYEGVGYGRRTVAWETSDASYVLNKGYSTEGLSAEMGLMWRLRKWVVSAGLLTIRTKYWEAVMGFGFHF